MKINEKVLNIPPYLSTTWHLISSIHMTGNLLVVTLKDGNTINIPGLQQEIIDSIFLHHAESLEKGSQDFPIPRGNPSFLQNLNPSAAGPSFQLALGSLDGLNQIMQHNPEQADAPELPRELLQKITSITKILASDDSIILPKAEPSCNCFHCQIARAFAPTEDVLLQAESSEEKDAISDEELQFQQWHIQQTNDQLFIVTNKLDEKEQYQVYLGEPLGCTCGKSGCEHLLAVLKS